MRWIFHFIHRPKMLFHLSFFLSEHVSELFVQMLFFSVWRLIFYFYGAWKSCAWKMQSVFATFAVELTAFPSEREIQLYFTILKELRSGCNPIVIFFFFRILLCLVRFEYQVTPVMTARPPLIELDVSFLN